MSNLQKQGKLFTRNSNHQFKWVRLPSGWARLLCLVMVLVVIVFIGLSRFVHEQLSAPELASLRTVLVWVLGSLTLVNLVLTGALALWMESAAGQKPVRVRFQQMLAALNHLEDGVVILDGEGRVTGVNVRARSIASATLRPHMRLGELFPFLDADQQRALLSGKETREKIGRAHV